MLGKFLYIGVGGSGTKTLRFVKDELERQLDAAGWTGEWPRAWQLLAIDLPPNEEDVIGRVTQLGATSYAGIAPESVEYEDYDSRLAGPQASASQREEFASWRPEPKRVTQLPWNGAGQFRAVGRTVVLERFADIRARVQTAVGTLNNDDTDAEFSQLSAAFGMSDRVGSASPMAIIVGSMAGGTGSGTLLDVADLVRLLGASGDPNTHWLNSVNGFLYTPEVFANLSETSRLGTEANSLAMWSEMMAAFYDDASLLPHHTRAGVTGQLDKRRGAFFNFLIGRGNNRFTLPNDVAVYQAVAQMFAAFATDSGLRSRFVASTQGNWAQSSGLTDEHPLRSREWEKPTAALGYASLGLGKERFARYARERLGRAQVTHLLEAHRRTVVAAAKDQEAARAMSREQIISQLVTEELFADFVDDCRLNERSEENNQVIEALLDPASAEPIVQSVLSEIKVKLNAGSKDDKGEKWLDRYFNLVTDFDQSVRQRITEAMVPNIREFCTATPDAIVDAVTHALGEHGIVITIALLDRLDEEIELILDELRSETTTRKNNAEQAKVNVRRVLDKSKVLGKNVRWTNAAFRKPIESAAETRFYNTAGEMVRERAIALISQIRSDIVKPMRLELERTEEELKDLTTRPSYDSWPQGSTVPKRFDPAPNEVLLVDPKTYPELLEHHLAQTVANEGDAVGGAIEQVMRPSQLPKSERSAIGAIYITRWMPPGIDGGNQRPKVSVRFSEDEILNRTGLWLRKDPTLGIGRYLAQSVNGWVTDEEVPTRVRDERARHLADSLDRTIGLAQPLIGQDLAELGNLHGLRAVNGMPPVSLALSPIPLKAGSAARREAEEVLARWGVGQDKASDYFADDSDVSEVVVSAQSAAVFPSVFSSLRNTIVSKWLETEGDPAIFGLRRRARNLLEAVPLPEDSVKSLVRGWYVASALNAMFVTEEIDADGQSTFVAHVLDASNRRVPLPVAGPSGRAGTPGELLGTVLDAYAITDLLTSAGNANLDGYTELQRWSVSNALRNWITEGQIPALDSPMVDPVATDARVGRGLVIEKLISDQITLLESIRAQPLPRTGWAKQTLQWNIAPLVIDVLRDLLAEIRGLTHAAPTPSGGYGGFG